MVPAWRRLYGVGPEDGIGRDAGRHFRRVRPGPVGPPVPPVYPPHRCPDPERASPGKRQDRGRARIQPAFSKVQSELSILRISHGEAVETKVEPPAPIPWQAPCAMTIFLICRTYPGRPSQSFLFEHGLPPVRH